MYKARRAFIYLLHKESVANDVINFIVCLRQSYVKNLECYQAKTRH